MTKTDKLVATIVAILCLTILFMAFTLHLKSKEVAACQSNVEVRYAYLERKLCDPYKAEVCYIDPDLRTELDTWHQEELQACK